ncbi:DNA-directed DNA polymerase [Asticcacaulis taihuensis]|uniref:DNA-directed DNA polymerase n=2 Tax=Asticcacaulis taihuensis TaxID=260084 RepID=A0A1G4QKA8_9CAUL|nr:DNA polymerase-4 [Asticcacaulis taihuensis]
MAQNADMKELDPRWRDGGDLRWLYLDMNSYFASCAQQDEPAIRNRPVIVVPVMSDYTCAIAASKEAKALGVKTGTQVKEARERIPGLVIREARPDRYVDLHNQILAQIDHVIPVEKVCSIDEVACRLMGPQQLEAPARALGHRIQRRILENVGECLTASIGIAPSRLLAKTAADMKKPLGLTVLRQDELPGALLELEIDEFAGIGRSMKARLNAAGVETVRQLWELSPSRMRQIWRGIMGENFWYALHGTDPLEIETHRASITHGHVLAQELRPAEHARGVARRLTAKCGSRLRRMGYKCGGLHLYLRGAGGERLEAATRFAVTSDSFRMLEASDDLWAQCARRLKAPRVKQIVVTCLHLIEAGAKPDLFGWTPDGEEDGRHMSLLSALDALNQKFGKDAITIGPRTKMHGFVGAKIAFNRIPEQPEFWE